jgi:hypothetical protein
MQRVAGIVGQGAQPGSKEYVDAIHQATATRLAEMAMADTSGKFAKQLAAAGSPASVVAQAGRMQDAKRTVRTGPKGTTTSTVYQ